MSWEDVLGWSWDIIPWIQRFEKEIPIGGRYVEVGVLFGRVLACLGTIRPDVELWAVDNFTSAVEHAHRPYVERYGRTTWEAFQGGMAEHVPEVLNRLHILRGDSAQMRRPDADLVFLDAGHDEASVRADIAHWRGQVKPGGILAGHDYEPAYKGLMKAVDELFPNAEHENSVWWTRMP